MRKVLFIFMIICLSGCQGINTLRRYGAEMDAQQKEMIRQQKIYEKVKLAVDDNKLEKGQAADEVRHRFSDPVVIINQGDGLERWVYKPGEVGMETEKVYFYFMDDVLVSWEYVPEKK